MKATTKRALWVGGLALAAVGATGGILLVSSKASAATPATQLVTGHTYKAQFQGPVSANTPQLTKAQSQTNFDAIVGPGLAVVQSVSYQTTATTLTGTVIFLYKGPNEPIPPALLPTAPGFTFTLTDLGAGAQLPPQGQTPQVNPNVIHQISPPPPPPPKQNVQQQSIVVQPGMNANAQNAGPNALLTVTAPSKLTQVAHTPVGIKSVLPYSGNQVTFVLDGQASQGAIQVTWGAGLSATINLLGSV